MTDTCSISPAQAGNECRAAKKTLRREKLFLRKNLSETFRREADHRINQHLLTFLREQNPRSLTAYITDGTEPDLFETLQFFLSCGGKLYLPRFESDSCYRIVRTETLELPMGKWGIPEPGPEAPEGPEQDLREAVWLIPGVAYDDSFHRLGRGKGIYDRFLEGGIRLGLGVFYECQHTELVPCEEHDRLMDGIVTEQGIRIRGALSNTYHAGAETIREKDSRQKDIASGRLASL